jgi:hypothetical protein
VVLDRPLVGEPQQRLPVVADRIADHSFAVLRRDLERRDRRRGVGGQVLLHEGRLPAQHPDNAQCSLGEHRHESVRDGVQVVDQVTLGGSGVGEQRLVEVGQPDAGPLFCGHADILPGSRHCRGRPSGRASTGCPVAA